jgi:homoaconitase/3-isopropylmalate dehydratase large subunit
MWAAEDLPSGAGGKWPGAAGMLAVGTDSHMTTHGAFGAFSVGNFATEMAGVWTEGQTLVHGALHLAHRSRRRTGTVDFGQNLILYIIGIVGADGASYRAVEFDGPPFGE